MEENKDKVTTNTTTMTDIEIEESNHSNAGFNIGRDNNQQYDSHDVNDSYNNVTNNHYYQTKNEIESLPVNPLLNSNNRTWLKTMVGKRVKIWAYAVAEYQGDYDDEDGTIVRYTIINLHNKDSYVADHIQLDIPIDIYEETIQQKIIWTEGLVYEYANGTKQAIRADKVNISHSNKIIINEDFIPGLTIMNSNEEFRYNVKRMREFSATEKFEMLLTSINELNNLTNIPRNFLSNYIINHYMINYDPESINRADLNLLIKDEISTCEIMFIIYSVIKRLSDGRLITIRQTLEYISQLINGMHGLNKNQNPILLNTNHKIQKLGLTKRFKEFCNKHNLNEVTAYRYIRTRNLDFHYGVIDPIQAYCDAFEIIFHIDENNMLL